VCRHDNRRALVLRLPFAVPAWVGLLYLFVGKAVLSCMTAAEKLVLSSTEPVFIAKSRVHAGLGVFLTFSELSPGDKVPIAFRYDPDPSQDDIDDIENVLVLDFPGVAFLDIDFGCAINHTISPNGSLAWIPHQESPGILLPTLWFEAIKRIRISTQELSIAYGPGYSSPGFST
jgi:hypothetical protein